MLVEARLPTSGSGRLLVRWRFHPRRAQVPRLAEVLTAFASMISRNFGQALRLHEAALRL